MSILIKGMEMPKSCDDCFLPLRYCPYAMKPDGSCPLVPVPPHGALMDRDDFFATCPELVDGYKSITDGLVVIPAEEGE